MLQGLWEWRTGQENESKGSSNAKHSPISCLSTTRAARCMRLHDSLLGFLLCKLPQRLSTAPERLCSARFCAPSALRPPGGPQTLTLLPPAGPSTPQPLLAVLRCASAPAKHGAAEDSWPIRDTTTFSPGVCPLSNVASVFPSAPPSASNCCVRPADGGPPGQEAEDRGAGESIAGASG